MATYKINSMLVVVALLSLFLFANGTVYQKYVETTDVCTIRLVATANWDYLVTQSIDFGLFVSGGTSKCNGIKGAGPVTYYDSTGFRMDCWPGNSGNTAGIGGYFARCSTPPITWPMDTVVSMSVGAYTVNIASGSDHDKGWGTTQIGQTDPWTCPGSCVSNGNCDYAHKACVDCRQGYDAGTFCSDINECANPGAYCPAGTCQNFDGGYNCVTLTQKQDVSCFGGSDGILTFDFHTATYSQQALPFHAQLVQVNVGPVTVANDVSQFTGLLPYSYHALVWDNAGHPAFASYDVAISQPASLPTLAVGSVTAAVCFLAPGQVVLVGSGGTPGYSYMMDDEQPQTSNVFAPLNGSHTFYAKDAKFCPTNSVTTFIDQPDTPVSLNFTQVNPVCRNDGGVVSLFAEGGTGSNYWFQMENLGWVTNNVFTDVLAGTYNFYAKDIEGCVATVEVTIWQPETLFVVTPTLNYPLCHGDANGKITVDAIGGLPPYAFVWDGSPENVSIHDHLIAGVYTVSVTDSYGCTRELVNDVHQPDVLATVVTPTNPHCFGGKNGVVAFNTAGGTTPYLLKIDSMSSVSQTFTGFYAGTHVWNITDAHNCFINGTQLLVNPPPFSCTLGIVQPCYNTPDSLGSLTIDCTGGTPPYTYQVADDPLNPPPFGSVNVFTLPTNEYYITVHDAQGCSYISSATFFAINPLELDIKEATNLRCYDLPEGMQTIFASHGVPGYKFRADDGDWSDVQSDGSFTLTSLLAGPHHAQVMDGAGCINTQLFTLTQPPQLIAGLVPDAPPNCWMAEVPRSVAGNGGTGGYTYSIDGGNFQTSTVFSLASGDHSLTIMDSSNCNLTYPVTVDMPTKVTMQTQVTPISCGVLGSISVTLSGGVPPYTYTFDEGAADTISSWYGLTVGEYQVSGFDSHGCPVDDTLEIINQTLYATYEVKNVLCNGGSDGSIVLHTYPGVPPYTYTLSSGTSYDASTISGLAAGTYDVTVTDSTSCTFDLLGIEITQPPQLVATVNPLMDVLCFGATVTVSASVTGGVTPYTWQAPADGALTQSNEAQWVLPYGNYNVTVYDFHKCVVIKHVTLYGLPLLVVEPTPTPPLCHGSMDGFIHLDAKGGNGDYLYSFDDASFVPESTLENVSAGLHQFTVHDTNGCSASGSIMVTQPDALKLSVVPLPTTPVSTTPDFRVSKPGASDGYINVLSAGGTLPFAYYINNASSAHLTVATAGNATLAHLNSDNYSVELVDANKCTISLLTLVRTPILPAAPEISLEVQANLEQITVHWNRPFDGYSPLIYFYAEIGQYNALLGSIVWSPPVVVGATNTSYTFMVSFGNVYYFQVAASNTIGIGSYSDMENVIAANVPQAPDMLIQNQPADATGRATLRLLLTPQNLTDLSIMFTVQYKIVGDSSWKVAVSNTTLRSFLLTDLTGLTSYEFRVQAINFAGLAGPFSLPATVNTLVAPSPPKDMLAGAFSTDLNGLSLSWETPASLGGSSSVSYSVLYSTDQIRWTLLGTTTDVTYFVTNLTFGISYMLSVMSTNEVGTSPTSANVTAVFGAPPPAPAPANVTSIQINGEITVITFAFDQVPKGWVALEYSDVSPFKRDDVQNGNWYRKDFIKDSNWTGYTFVTGYTYWIRTYAINSIGSSAPTYLSDPIVAAGVPGALDAPVLGGVTFEEYTASFVVQWRHPNLTYGISIDQYQIVVTSNHSVNTFMVETPAPLNFTVNGVVPGMVAYVAIRARNRMGYGPYVNASINPITFPPAPAAPVLGAPVIADGEASISFLWEPSFPILDGNVTVAYVIEQANYLKSDPNSSTPWTTYTLLDAAPVHNGSLYTYQDQLNIAVHAYTVVYLFRVRAMNSFGYSKPSTIKSVEIKPVLPRPTILSSQVLLGAHDTGVSSVQVFWAQDSVAQVYRSEYSLDGSVWSLNELVNVSTSAQLLSSTFSGLTTGATYQFRVTGMSADLSSSSPHSIPTSILVAVAPQSSPTLLVPSVSVIPAPASGAVLSWASAEYTGIPVKYNVLVSSVDMVSFTQTEFEVIAQNLTQTNYTVSSLVHQTIYYYAVQPLNDVGYGSQSISSVAIEILDIPPAPASVTVGHAIELTTGEIAAEVDWSEVTGYNVDYYQVEVSEDGTNWTVAAEHTGCCYAVLHNLTVGENIMVRVTAHNPTALGPYTAAPATQIIVKPGAMLRPTFDNVEIDTVMSSLTLTWTAVTFPGATSDVFYVVEMATYADSPVWTIVTPANYTGFSWSTSTLNTGSEYLFRVTAQNDAGSGEPSPSADILLTSAPLAPASVMLDTHLVLPLKLSVSWNASLTYGLAVNYYRVTYSVFGTDSSGVSSSVIVPATDQQVVNTYIPVMNGWTYNVSVYAVNTAGQSVATNGSMFINMPPIVPATAPTFGPITITHSDLYYSTSVATWFVSVGDINVTRQELYLSLDKTNWDLVAYYDFNSGATANTTSISVTSRTLFSNAYFTVPTGSTYYLRVNTSNVAGAGPFSDISHFISVNPPVFNTSYFNASIPVEDKLQSVTMTWDPALDYSNTPDIVYLVQGTLDPPYTIQKWINLSPNITATTVTVSLQIGGTYYLRVYALNAAGKSPYNSMKYTVIIHPDPVDLVSVLATSEDVVTIAFEPPFNGGTYLASYIVFTLVTQPDSTYGPQWSTFTNRDVDLLPDGRYQLLVPAVAYSYHSLAVSCMNSANLAANLSDLSVDVFAANLPRLIEIMPNNGTILGGATVSVMTEEYWVASSRSFCKFGDVSVPNYNFGIDMSISDFPYFTLGCVAPSMPVSGDFTFSVSYDGVFWSSNSLPFTYFPAPAITRLGSTAAPITGSTLTLYGTNLENVQNRFCGIGQLTTPGKLVQGEPNAFECDIAPSLTISLPRLPIYVYLDYVAFTLPQTLYYYDPSAVYVSRLSVTSFNSAIGQRVFVYGNFPNTGDTMVIGFESYYGFFTTRATYVSQSTLTFQTIALPGDYALWTIAVSLNNGVDYHTFPSITIEVANDQNACTSLICIDCAHASDSCSWVSVGNGQGWCRAKFTGVGDGFSPEPAPAPNYCLSYSLITDINYVPYEFVYSADSKMVSVTTTVHYTMYAEQAGQPLESYFTCRADYWNSVTPDLTPLTIAASNDYTPFYGFAATGTFQCTYSYDGTGFEELYDFTAYGVSVYTYWGWNAFEGMSTANDSAIATGLALVKPNITIVGDDFKDFFYLQNAGVVHSFNMHLVGATRVRHIEIMWNDDVLYSAVYPDFSTVLAWSMPQERIVKGVYLLRIMVDGEPQIVRNIFVTVLPTFVSQLMPGGAPPGFTKRSNLDMLFAAAEAESETSLVQSSPDDPTNCGSSCKFDAIGQPIFTRPSITPSPTLAITAQTNLNEPSTQASAFVDISGPWICCGNPLDWDFSVTAPNWPTRDPLNFRSSAELGLAFEILATKLTGLGNVNTGIVLSNVTDTDGDNGDDGDDGDDGDGEDDGEDGGEDGGDGEDGGEGEGGEDGGEDGGEGEGGEDGGEDGGEEGGEGGEEGGEEEDEDPHKELTDSLAERSMDHTMDILYDNLKENMAEHKKKLQEHKEEAQKEAVAKTNSKTNSKTTSKPLAETAETKAAAAKTEAAEKAKVQSKQSKTQSERAASESEAAPSAPKAKAPSKPPAEEVKNEGTGSSSKKAPAQAEQKPGVTEKPPPEKAAASKPGAHDDAPSKEKTAANSNRRKTEFEFSIIAIEGEREFPPIPGVNAEANYQVVPKGIEFQISLSNKDSESEIPGPSPVAGTYGITFTFGMDIQFMFAGDFFLDIYGGLQVSAGGSGGAKRQGFVDIGGYGDFALTWPDLAPWPIMQMRSFTILIDGGVLFSIPLLQLAIAEVDFGVGAQLSVQLTINNPAASTPDDPIPALDWDFGHGYSAGLEGSFALILELSGKIGVPGLCVDVTIDVIPRITLGSGEPLFKGFDVTIQLTITVEVLVLKWPFTIGIDLNLISKRSQVVNQYWGPMEAITGTWANLFNHAAARFGVTKRVHGTRSLTAVTSQLLLDDVYTANRLRLSDMSPSSGKFVSVWLAYNSSLTGPEAFTAVYTTFDTTDGWTEPKQISPAVEPDDMPVVVTFGADQAISAWPRAFDDNVPGAINDTTSQAVYNASEIVVSLFDFTTGTWTEPERLTNNALPDSAVSVVEFADATGALYVMVVWQLDLDGNVITLEKDFYYSIYDGSSWSTPQVFASGIETREVVALEFCAEQGVVAAAYTASRPLPDFQPGDDDPTQPGYNPFESGKVSDALIKPFYVVNRTWGEEMLLGAYSDYAGGNSSNKMVTMTVHGNYFVAAWVYGFSVVYKLWSPTEPYRTVYVLSPTEKSITTLTLAHADAVDTTVATWVINGNYSTFGYYYAVMEPGSELFGSAIFVEESAASGNQTVDVWAQTALINVEGSDDPYLLRLYLNRDLLQMGNSTSYGTARIKYDVLALGAYVAPVYASFDLAPTGFVASLIMQNSGVLALNKDEQYLTVHTGDENGINDNSSLLLVSPIEALGSGANATFTFSWVPDTKFQGYAWVQVKKVTTDEVVSMESILLTSAPSISHVEIKPSQVSTGNVLLQATVTNTFPFAITSVPIPIRVLVPQTGKATTYNLLSTAWGVLPPTGSGSAILNVEVPATQITSNLLIIVGNNSRALFDVDVNPDAPSYDMYTYKLPTTNLLLDTTSAQLIDPFVHTATFQVAVKNAGIVPVVDTSIAVFLEAFGLFDSSDSIFSESIAYADIPYLPPLSTTPILLSFASWNYTGPMSVMVMVNPYQLQKELNYADNLMYTDLTIYPQWKMVIPQASLVLDAQANTISFPLTNFGMYASEINISVFHQSQLTDGYELIGSVPFTNITTDSCNIGTLELDADFLVTNTTAQTLFAVVIPAYYSGTTDQVSYYFSVADAQTSNKLTDCSIALGSSPSVLALPDVTIFLGDDHSMELLATLVDSHFVLEFGVDAPSFATLAAGANNTATLTLAPNNTYAPEIANSSTPGVQQFALVTGLVDSGEFYSQTSFTLTVLYPVVNNVSKVHTNGGRVTVHGVNFGNNAEEITSGFHANNTFIACENVTMEEPGSAFSCDLPPTSGYRIPLSVRVRRGTNIDTNSALSFTHTFALDPRLDGRPALVVGGIAQTFSIAISGVPQNISLALDCSSSQCVISPPVLDFSPNETVQQFSVLFLPNAKMMQYSIVYTVTGDNALYAETPVPSQLVVVDIKKSSHRKMEIALSVVFPFLGLAGAVIAAGVYVYRKKHPIRRDVELSPLELSTIPPAASAPPAASNGCAAPVVSDAPPAYEASAVSEAPAASKAPIISETPVVSETPAVPEALAWSEEPVLPEPPEAPVMFEAPEAPAWSEEPVLPEPPEAPIMSKAPEATAVSEGPAERAPSEPEANVI